jgi:hypothetical protein
VSKIDVLTHVRTLEPVMIADLDTLLTALYVELADRIIPMRGFTRSGPGQLPEVTDAELVFIAVAQVLLRHDDEWHWLRAAPKLIGHLFPRLLGQSEYNTRLKAAAPLMEAALRWLADATPGTAELVRLMDATPVPCGRSVITARRSDLAGWAGYGHCPSPQRRNEGGLLPLVGSPTSEPVRRCGPELPHNSAETRRCHHAQLQHRGQVVPGGPVLSQFSVLDAEPVAVLTGEPLATRRQKPVEPAGVGACQSDSYRNHVFVRNDGLDPCAQVRKLAKQPLGGPAHGGWPVHLSRRCSGKWRGRVLGKVVSHELVARSHLPLIPDLFEVASNEVLVGI